MCPRNARLPDLVAALVRSDALRYQKVAEQ